MNQPGSTPPPVRPESKPDFTGLGIGVVVGILCEIGGYLLMRGSQEQYGEVVFLLVPSISGFFISVFTRRGIRLGQRLTTCAVVTVLLTLSFLIFLGLEGYICCLMALPLVFSGIALGMIIGVGFKHAISKDDRDTSPRIKILLLVFAAFFLIGAKAIERPHIEKARYETFETRVTLPVPPQKAWDLIKRMDKLNAQEPFLLRIGLPLPQSCELDREAVGGRRVCHFNSGIIAQEITEWDAPKAMRFKITESTLPGRHWLKFISAGYDFIPDGNGTVVVRSTTISSGLYPRWYWRMFEAWGVESEHAYVLEDLRRRAEMK